MGREWLAKEQGQWTAHHRIATTSRIERLIFPRIGSLSMDSIELPDMLALCNATKDGVSVYMAHVILGICGRIFRYGVVCGYVTSDPCRDLKGALPSHKHKPMAALVNPKDIARLMKAIDVYDGDIKTRSVKQMPGASDVAFPHSFRVCMAGRAACLPLWEPGYGYGPLPSPAVRRKPPSCMDGSALPPV